ncbi:Outer membrane protein beta-barrel domain-containing protein [Ekhidna lutea]|uniref:Outer membrane protein beta-barrel domain-containing protein n=1 Tax=Ekhidna lutea TaxID=447679 RepID=A0A239M1I1_EKHLU|nr:outer membrane beta-barrel protein [Ekhidna lutea]SNT36586.1 Outer membrane protein beta-barrel domain-containing protein [Ekhidna lutea]
MRVVWLICTLCLVHTGVAQKTYVGVKAGGHVSTAFIEHTIFNLNHNSTFLPGTNGGIFIKYLPKAGNSFLNSGIQVGANYVQKGWKQTFFTDEPNYKARMNYLEIPLEGIGYFGGENKYFISAGFYAEFLMSYSLDPEPDSENRGGADFYTYEKDRDREFGYGGRIGGGLFRDLSIGTFQLEGFFSYSFSNFIDAGDLTTETPDLSNHWMVGFTVGYMISLNKKETE